MNVFIVGAGPGDPELITVKGQKLLSEADVIIYAGSLVNPALLDYAKAGCEIHNSASMTLPQVINVIEDGVKQGKMVVRLHTGDPSIYGAIQEQMDALDKLGIEYKVVPGVSSFLATAAALKQEYTLPGISQTVIITRNEGRTPVPDREKLRSLAAHQATMCIFLSITISRMIFLRETCKRFVHLYIHRSVFLVKRIRVSIVGIQGKVEFRTLSFLAFHREFCLMQFGERFHQCQSSS